MAGPVVSYGFALDGAKDLNLNSGRELFRCGLGCVNMFITNVTLDYGIKFIKCGTIADALVGGNAACMQSAQVGWRDQSVVNWEAKEGVNSGMSAGTVITRAADCAGEGASIYTHTEGQLSGRCQANIATLNSVQAAVMSTVLAKNDLVGGGISGDLDWIFSDISTQASATDWQGGSVTYIGFGTAGVGDTSYNFSFNWQNGKAEVTNGTMYYDESVAPDSLESVVASMLTTVGF